MHHSGILPILKEIVEMLFSRGLVKVSRMGKRSRVEGSGFRQDSAVVKNLGSNLSSITLLDSTFLTLILHGDIYTTTQLWA